eukprot:scaffold95944_cov33-Tisochrysis_lutea.AAC.1
MQPLGHQSCYTSHESVTQRAGLWKPALLRAGILLPHYSTSKRPRRRVKGLGYASPTYGKPRPAS